MRTALLVPLLIVAACTSESRTPSDHAAYSVARNAPAPVQLSVAESCPNCFSTGSVAVPKLDRPMITRLIRMARVSLEVNSLDSAIGAARSVASHHGGFAAGLDHNLAASWRPQAALTLRVPVDRLDAAIDALRGLGQVEAVSVTTQDVTEEFVDVTARLENARRLERRLLDLLSRGTGKLTDVLQVEEKLASVREEVERIEGRRRYLQVRSDMSTIEVALHEAGIPPAPRTASAIGDAFGQARRNLMVLTTTAIEASGIVLPLLIVAGVVWVLVRRGRRRLGPAGDATA